MGGAALRLGIDYAQKTPKQRAFTCQGRGHLSFFPGESECGRGFCLLSKEGVITSLSCVLWTPRGQRNRITVSIFAILFCSSAEQTDAEGTAAEELELISISCCGREI